MCVFPHITRTSTPVGTQRTPTPSSPSALADSSSEKIQALWPQICVRVACGPLVSIDVARLCYNPVRTPVPFRRNDTWEIRVRYLVYVSVQQCSTKGRAMGFGPFMLMVNGCW